MDFITRMMHRVLDARDRDLAHNPRSACGACTCCGELLERDEVVYSASGFRKQDDGSFVPAGAFNCCVACAPEMQRAFEAFILAHGERGFLRWRQRMAN
jgi:hypothetical protein